MFKCLSSSKFAWLIFKPFYCCLGFCSECSHSWPKPFDHFIRIFRVLHTVQFSRFCAVLVFLSDSLASLSQLFLFVKSFLNFFRSFFQHSASWNFKRRRRDLNPRAATNDLLPFQGSPFSHLGTSAFMAESHSLRNPIFSLLHRIRSYPTPRYSSGESGIRTHAPLRTNGFQDRLVMTTSISLQSALSNVLLHSIRYLRFCQALFKTFFTSFSDHPKKPLPQSYPPVLSP